MGNIVSSTYNYMFGNTVYSHIRYVDFGELYSYNKHMEKLLNIKTLIENTDYADEDSLNNLELEFSILEKWEKDNESPIINHYTWKVKYDNKYNKMLYNNIKNIIESRIDYLEEHKDKLN